MQRKRSQKPDYQVKIARERIEILFKVAEKEIENYPERSRRYIELARKIGLRYNIRLSKQMKRTFCKKCNNLLIIGKTAEEKESKIPNIKMIKCLNCEEIKKIPK